MSGGRTPHLSATLLPVTRLPQAHVATLPSVPLQHTALYSPPFVYSFCVQERWLGTTDLKWLTQDNGNTKGDRQQAAGSAVIPPTYGNCLRGLSIIGIPWSCKLHDIKHVHWRHDSMNFTRYCPLVSNIALSGRNSPKLWGKTCLLTLKATANGSPPIV